MSENLTLTNKESNRIKVLRIIGHYVGGGVETIAFNYYKNLDHSKIAMDFMYLGDSLPPYADEIKANGDSVISVADYTNLKSVFQISNAVRRGSYDIIHAQLNAMNFFPLLGAKLGGAKIRIASNHSTANLHYEFKKSLLKYILRPSVKLIATNYAACSKHAGEWLFGKRNLANSRVKILYNAINLEDFTFCEMTRQRLREMNSWNDQFVVGHIGRFIAQKNHGFIIEVFEQIVKQYPNSKLVLIGTGPMLSEIKQMVSSRMLTERVSFLGARTDVNELMQGMDLFLFPSIYEGLGNVLTEAQAVSLMSLASDVVPKEVKNTQYVEFLSLKASPFTWANKALEYKSGYPRLDTHGELTSAGYDIVTAAGELEDYYCDLIHKAGR